MIHDPKRKRRNTAEAQLAARRRQIAKLLLQGFSQSEIADKLGCSPWVVSRDARAIAERFRKEASADMSNLRAAELSRVEHVLNRAAMEFEKQADPRHGELILRATSLRSKLLGLDCPSVQALEAEKEQIRAALMIAVTLFIPQPGPLRAFSLCVRAALIGQDMKDCPEYEEQIRPYLSRLALVRSIGAKQEASGEP